MTPKTAVTCAALAVASLAVTCRDGFSQPAQPRQERVTLARGATSATVTGRLKGSEDVDYLVRAAAGQTITVSLQHSNASNYFNVIAPGHESVAMYVGDVDEPFTALLPADGDYRIRVYLARAAARRPNASSTYTLSVTVTGTPLAPLPARLDALVRGTAFHASASILCVAAPYADRQPKPCPAFVIRRGTDGTATVDVPLGSGVARRILFVRGRPVASDSAEKLTYTREGDVTIVAFDSGEIFHIPDAFVVGG